MVYDDAEKLYAEVTSDGKHMLEDALSVLLPGSKAAGGGIGGIGAAATEFKRRGSLVALNTTPFPRREVIRVPAGLGLQRATEEDEAKDGYSPKYVSDEFTLVDVPASGAALVGAAPRLERIMPASGEDGSTSKGRPALMHANSIQQREGPLCAPQRDRTAHHR